MKAFFKNSLRNPRSRPLSPHPALNVYPSLPLPHPALNMYPSLPLPALIWSGRGHKKGRSKNCSPSIIKHMSIAIMKAAKATAPAPRSVSPLSPILLASPRPYTHAQVHPACPVSLRSYTHPYLPAYPGRCRPSPGRLHSYSHKPAHPSDYIF